MIDQDNVDVDISFVNDEAVFSYWKEYENFRKELFELSNMKDIEKIHSFAEHLIWGHCEEPWMRKTLEVGQIRCDYARILMAVVKSFLNSTKDFRQLELSSFEEEFGHFNCLDGSIDALVKNVEFQFKKSWEEGCWAAGYWLSCFYCFLGDHEYSMEECPFAFPDEGGYVMNSQIANSWFNDARKKGCVLAIMDRYRSWTNGELTDAALIQHYPNAVYEYARALPEADYKKAILLEWSLRFDSVREYKKFWDAYEEEEAEKYHCDAPPYGFGEAMPRLSDYYDDMSEIELNTRGDGYD